MDFSYAWSIREDFVTETFNTLYMAAGSALVAGAIGLILGILLVVTKPGGILAAPRLNSVLDKIVNLLRAVPFIIMLSVIAPVTRAIVGQIYGETAAIVPLSISAFPFFAKQVEQALSTVSPGLVEAAEAMGDTPTRIIGSVYLREGLPHLIRAGAITLISLIGLTTMAGTVGAGGIGKLAISVGYNRFEDEVTLICLLITLALVYLVQGIANILIRRTTH